MADPGFPRRGGANPQGGGANLLFCPNFPENCMKMKEFGPRGGGARPWRPPLDPPMTIDYKIKCRYAKGGNRAQICNPIDEFDKILISNNFGSGGSWTGIFLRGEGEVTLGLTQVRSL